MSYKSSWCGKQGRRRRFAFWARWTVKIDGRYVGFCHYCAIEIHYSDQCFHGEIPPEDLATIDHVIPLSKGGSNHVSNLVWSCRKCNEAKGASIINAQQIDTRSPV